MKPIRVDERVVEFKSRLLGDRMAGYLGPISSTFTLAWLATHRGRLRTLIFGGRRFSLLLIYDSKGTRTVDHSDDEVEALATIVYGDRKGAK